MASDMHGSRLSRSFDATSAVGETVYLLSKAAAMVLLALLLLVLVTSPHHLRFEINLAQITRGHLIAYGSSLLFAVALPFAIMVARDSVRRTRLATLDKLSKFALDNGGRPEAIPSLDFALDRYSEERAHNGDRWAYYLAPGIIFSGVCFIGFLNITVLANTDAYWVDRNFILSGFTEPVSEGVPADPAADLAERQRQTGTAVAFGFIGAYVWAILYLLRRVANYDLSPISFLRVAVQILFACFVVAVAWQVADALNSGWVTPALFAAAAFLIGFYPRLGLDHLFERLVGNRLKTTYARAGEVSVALPLIMIDGIDYFVGFRLSEYEIEDAQALAAANPFELHASTPYGLLQIMDWVAQAQLLVAVGPERYRKLRDANVRTLFDIGRLGQHAATRGEIVRVLTDGRINEPADPELFATLYATMFDDLHVQRLAQLWDYFVKGYNERRPRPAPELGVPWPPVRGHGGA